MKDKQTEFVEKLSAEIVAWDVQIDQIKNEMERATAEAKHEHSKTIFALELKRNQAAEKLQGIAMATDDEWEDMKTGAEQIWDEVKGLLKGAIKKTV
jgi:hypothetical protein